MTKYAVYIVIVEDTESDDRAMFDRTPGEVIDRVAGDLDMDDAQTLVDDVKVDYGNTDIAR